MASRFHAISTLFAVAGMLAMLSVGGLQHAGVDRALGDSHSHTHYHTHDGSTHAHGHHHGGHQVRDRFVASDKGDCEYAVVEVHLPSDPHHGCCHEDHSHPSPVFVTVTSSRWDDRLAPLSFPHPDLWQPVAFTSPVIQPIPPPPRGCLGDPISQLRTVVMLT